MKTKCIQKLTLALAATGIAFSTQSAKATITEDLTGGGSVTINGGIFSTTTYQTAGTGSIDPFLRLQQHGNNTYEAAYNTEAGTPLDADNSWNYNLLLSSLATVTVGGIDYYNFLLDLNEPDNGKDNYITLNQVEIFASNTQVPATGVGMDSVTGRATSANLLGDLIWDMNAGGDPTAYQVLLDYGLQGTGSGGGDMQLLVPTSVFNGKTYVVMYSQFGYGPTTNGVASDAGFEEWNAVKGTHTTSVPEPSTLIAGALLLLPFGISTVRILRKRQTA